MIVSEIPFGGIERSLLMRPELVVKSYRELKDVTRRPVKDELDELLPADGDHTRIDRGELEIRCPYGSAGDRLWIREPFRILDYTTAYGNDARIVTARVQYKADSFERVVTDLDVQRRRSRSKPGSWTPSIHMWRWASRLLLEVVSVGLKRLQVITAADVVREGFEVPAVDYSVPEDPRVLDQERECFARGLFSRAWDSIYKPPRAWANNPLVWRIEYKIVEVRKP